MADCAHCGGPLTEAMTQCPLCRRPVAGRTKTSKGTRMAILMVVVGAGCLVLVAVVGIVAAVVTPSFLEALERAKQKRTVADIRSLGTALMAYGVDHEELPAVASVDELAAALVPEYIPEAPTQDAWERALRYECWSEGDERRACVHFALGSAGQDGEWELESLREYADPEPFAPTDRDRDIVYVDGYFTRWPQAPPG